MTTTRSLLIATAGHVNHGKSTLLERLTGHNPDRLPEEKARGMTLDLGFLHTPEFSFVDCPGHERFVRHTTAGHSSIDGALFVVAASEGLQEQSREHARILKWLGVQKILIVMTKADLVLENLATDFSNGPLQLFENLGKRIQGQVQELFDGDTTLDLVFTSTLAASLNGSSLLEKVLTPANLLKKMRQFFSPTKQIASHNFDRFFIDRAFTLKGIGTVLTGTFSEGFLERGQKVELWIPGREKTLPITIKNLRRDEKELPSATEPCRLALSVDGVKPSEISRGSCLLFGESPHHMAAGFALNLAWALSGVLPAKKEMTVLLQCATLTHEVILRKHPLGFWRARSDFSLPLRRHDLVTIRTPHRVKGLGHTIGGGVVVDVAMPAGKILEAPPVDDAKYFEWLHKSKAKNFGLRMGMTKAQLKNLESSQQLKNYPLENLRAKSSSNSDLLNEKLLQEIFEGRWQAVVEKKDLNDAHALVKAGQAFHIKENQFLHSAWNNNLLTWLREKLKSNQNELSVEDARTFFLTGRKNFLNILEYCDRHQWTFRTKNGRKALRLPSSSRPSVSPPSRECEREKQTVHLDDLYS